MSPPKLSYLVHIHVHVGERLCCVYVCSTVVRHLCSAVQCSGYNIITISTCVHWTVPFVFQRHKYDLLGLVNMFHAHVRKQPPLASSTSIYHTCMYKYTYVCTQTHIYTSTCTRRYNLSFWDSRDGITIANRTMAGIILPHTHTHIVCPWDLTEHTFWP